MVKQIFLTALFLCLTFFSVSANANPVGEGKKILYIPIDNRPVCLSQTVDVAEKLGYEILVPPGEFLGNEENYGEPEELWKWLKENAPGANAAVISSDAMIYGSLVGSRKHDLEPGEIMTRAENFKKFREDFPRLPLYVFGTIMRTPRSGSYSSAEPEYYKDYGGKIFDYTVLCDRAEVGEISHRQKLQMRRLKKEIPEEYLEDWLGRRKKNYAANEYFTDLTRSGVFDYFLLGCDDSAIFSQTHMESRHLENYAEGLEKWKFLVTSGADELGILMLARAINKDLGEMPFISAVYNEGAGADTVPDYCNERIGLSIDAATFAVGGMPVPSPAKADLVLAVNTNINGKTLNAASVKNTFKMRKDIKKFMPILKDCLDKNYKVGLVDIAFGNGADNSLMYQVLAEDIQFKFAAYGGWNTATNSSGFLIGTGVLTKFMNEDEKNSLLVTRYLDDWGYQANVRQEIATYFYQMNDENKAEKLAEAEVKGNESILRFARDNLTLPAGRRLENLKLTYPWKRMFEAEVTFNFER